MRWTSGPRIPGEDPENALLTAWSAARNGNTNAITSRHGLERARHRARRDEGDERDRQGEQERQERGSAHLPGDATDGHAQGAEGETAERQRHDPREKRAHSR